MIQINRGLSDRLLVTCDCRHTVPEARPGQKSEISIVLCCVSSFCRQVLTVLHDFLAGRVSEVDHCSILLATDRGPVLEEIAFVIVMTALRARAVSALNQASAICSPCKSTRAIGSTTTLARNLRTVA